MNTEFPNRIPTVVNNQATTSSKTTSIKVVDSDDTKSFQKDAKEALKKLYGWLEKVNDTVYDFFTDYKNNENDRKKAKTKVSAKPDSVDIAKNKDNKNDDDEESFMKALKWALNDIWMDVKKTADRLSLKNTSFITSLQKTIESTNASIGSAIGGVFGSGLIGKAIGGTITKALNFAVSKVLVGIVASNLPMILLVGGIIAAIGTLIYFAEDIWDSIKWLGWAIDQGIDAIIDVLPWGKSKYADARKQMAEGLGVSEDAIKAMYGDTVRGRNQMYEDYKAIMNGEITEDELDDLAMTASLFEDSVEDNVKATQDLTAAIRGTNSSQAQNISNIINNTYNSTPESSTILPSDADLDYGMSMAPSIVVNNVNSGNTTAASVNSTLSGLSSIGFGQPAGVSNGMTPITWGK